MVYYLENYIKDIVYHFKSMLHISTGFQLSIPVMFLGEINLRTELSICHKKDQLNDLQSLKLCNVDHHTLTEENSH